ncbi:hypothetical protein J4230_05550 [Candidatus Woesearchaeota archaeon]|nr:hypothetical protein [Candidatus Woesearchaeota archaeon]
MKKKKHETLEALLIIGISIHFVFGMNYIFDKIDPIPRLSALIRKESYEITK